MVLITLKTPLQGNFKMHNLTDSIVKVDNLFLSSEKQLLYVDRMGDSCSMLVSIRCLPVMLSS